MVNKLKKDKDSVETKLCPFACQSGFTLQKMRIAVLYEDYSVRKHYLNELEPPRDVAVFDNSNLHIYDNIPIKDEDDIRKLKELVIKGKYDVYINLCESFEDGCALGIRVTLMLQKLNVAYTGADPTFYQLSKLGMKIAARTCDINIPEHVYIHSLDELHDGRLDQLEMPVIVKHTNGHDSIGLTIDSCVTDRTKLNGQIQQMFQTYGSAIVEQFIKGPEFTVLVVENPDDDTDPIALTPVQCIFPNGRTFKYFDLKWDKSPSLEIVKDAKLADQLKSHAKMVFRACDGHGYARCDFRQDAKTGELYFLEINANPSIFYGDPINYGSADLILKFDPLGHTAFIKLITDCALKRQERYRPRIRVDYNLKKGFYLSAAIQFEINDVIYTQEYSAVSLVSEKFVTKNWTKESDAMMNKWFNIYSYSIGPGLYATWDKDPGLSLPINHSCDPNSWLDGMDVVARRPISKGQEITMDYATFAILDAPNVANDFECHCGTVQCRIVIRPSNDFKLLDIREKYMGHFSSYVESLIEKL